MKIVFIGTPDYVLPIVNGLYKSFRDKKEQFPIAAVVTQKPKPVGRKQTLEYSPVDKWAHKKNIPIFFDLEQVLEEKVKADIGILAAYGKFIPEDAINYFRYGILNIHPSLLPKFRGASPVRATIASGDTETGVSIIKLDNKLDHGPIVSQYKEEVKTKDNTQTLRSRLFEKSADALISLLPAYVSGKIKLKEQDHKSASYTKEIKRSDAIIPPEYLEAAMKGVVPKDKWQIAFIKDFTTIPTPQNICNFILAMEPWPIAWTNVNLNSKVGNQKPKRLKILEAHLDKQKEMLILDKVQLEGKNPVSWNQFKQGYPEANFI